MCYLRQAPQRGNESLSRSSPRCIPARASPSERARPMRLHGKGNRLMRLLRALQSKSLVGKVCFMAMTSVAIGLRSAGILRASWWIIARRCGRRRRRGEALRPRSSPGASTRLGAQESDDPACRVESNLDWHAAARTRPARLVTRMLRLRVA